MKHLLILSLALALAGCGEKGGEPKAESVNDNYFISQTESNQCQSLQAEIDSFDGAEIPEDQQARIKKEKPKGCLLIGLNKSKERY